MARLFDRAEAEAAETVALSSTPAAAPPRGTLAVAVAALLVSLLVVSRSTAALGGEAASLGNLFGLTEPPAAAGEDMAPGGRHQQCITITYGCPRW